jgi:hypothetical protein
MGLVDFEFAWGFVQWIGVGCRVDFWWIPVGVCVVVGRGGLRGGSRWVCEVALGGGFWSIPVVMGACDYYFFIANKNNNNNNNNNNN